MMYHGGYIPFDKLSKVRSQKSLKKNKLTKNKPPKNRSRKKPTPKKISNTCECKDSQVIIEKGSGKKRCANCVDSGIILRGDDDNLYILKKARSISKWVKI